MCRYGGQDVFRILGRDPITQPLTPLERSLFLEALCEYMTSEASPSPTGGSAG